jgi:hypothetical protein
MSHNKGKRYFFCKECDRKRYVISIDIGMRNGHDLEERTCSKGHKWEVVVGPNTRIIKEEINRILPKLKELFERDDSFFANLKSRR